MFAIVDLETTGGSNRWGKITEVAIFIHDGRQLVDSFSSLVNPGMPIPPYITQLTGISDDMVANAPRFEDIANTIQSVTDGCILVAHNATFDYNFLRQEFLRMGDSYNRPNLCTVRLSRKFLPGHDSYSLGRLCAALNIPLEGRHRAGGDAAATVRLFELILQTTPEENWLPYVQPAEGQPSPLNRYLTSSCLEDIPTSPGILFVLDEKDQPIYIEGARHLHKRAKAILNNKGGKRLFNLRQHLSNLQFEETGNYLLAQLKAAELALKHRPAYNKLPKNTPTIPSGWQLSLEPDLTGLLQFSISKSQSFPPMFSSKRKAQEAVSQLRDNYFLKPNLPEKLATPDSYNQRALAALNSIKSDPTDKLYVLRGRHPHELCILMQEGLNVRFGYAEKDNELTLNKLADYCTRTIAHPQAAVFMHKHLGRERVIRSFSLAHVEEKEFISGI